MPKVTLDVPEKAAQLLKAMEARLRREAEAARTFGDVDPEGAFEAIDEAAEALQRPAKWTLLRSYDVDAPRRLARCSVRGARARHPGSIVSHPSSV